MMTKTGVAYTIIAAFFAIVLAQTWLFDGHVSVPPWVWVLVGLSVIWALWTIRERPDPKAKLFDFNPRRGLLFFLCGFVIFPISALFDALFGANLSLSSMIVATLFGSVFVGLVGIFTENVGF